MFDGQTAWTRLGACPSHQLSEARLQLHFGAQTVSGLARTHGPKRDDDSHTSLVWDRRRESLSSQRVPFDRVVSAELMVNAELRFPTFSIQLFVDGRMVDELSLGGLSTAEADAWMSDSLARAASKSDWRPLTPLHYEMPAHPLREGATFQAEFGPQYAELARWYGNAAAVLQEMLGSEPTASSVLCWPHHFDIAILIPLDDGKSVGVGLSPGDSSYDQPYFYVGPYPSPKPEALPALPGAGGWHTDGFIAAVLAGGDILKHEDAAGQYSLVVDFLTSAIAASKQVLEGSDGRS